MYIELDASEGNCVDDVHFETSTATSAAISVKCRMEIENHCVNAVTFEERMTAARLTGKHRHSAAAAAAV